MSQPPQSVPSTPNLEFAYQVAEAVHLVDLHLEELRAKGGQARDVQKAKIRLASKADHKLENGGTLTIAARMSVMAVADGQIGDEPVMRIDATFLVTYKVKEGSEFTDDHYRAFAAVNGIFNVWPFWRELVQSTSTRMGYTPLTLPLHRITQPANQTSPSLPKAQPKTAKKRRDRKV